jgi:hypothetical protein
MKKFIEEVAERLDRQLFSIAGVVSGILQGPGPMNPP